MVRINKLLQKDSNLKEYNEVKDIVAKQLAEQLTGGYLNKLFETIKVEHNKPETIKEVVVGNALIGSGYSKIKCHHCKGQGYNRKQMCVHCNGSGWLDWVNKGFNFISSILPHKKQEDVDFLVHGPRKTELLALLGLPSSASKSEVNKVYRKLALKHHPDKGGNPEDFRRINEIKTELIGGKLYKGEGFFDDFADGFKRGFNTVTKPVLNIASMIPGKIGMVANTANSIRNGLLGDSTFGSGVSNKKVVSKNDVWNNVAKKTSGGLTKADLMKNSRGKIVSIKQFEAGQRAYENIKNNRK